jgi:hypothetical protein
VVAQIYDFMQESRHNFCSTTYFPRNCYFNCLNGILIIKHIFQTDIQSNDLENVYNCMQYLTFVSAESLPASPHSAKPIGNRAECEDVQNTLNNPTLHICQEYIRIKCTTG